MHARRLFLAFSSLAALFGPAHEAVAADDWPSKLVTIVVPYPSGSATDAIARVLAERLTAKWKQTVIVDNKPGGVERIATSYVARAKPDGYTLLLGTEAGLETNQFLFSKLEYNPTTDFTPIMRLMEAPLLYVVKTDSPYQSIQQLIAVAKKEPEKITFGSTGPGGSIHLAVNWFAATSGDLQLRQVSYRGVSQAMQDMLAGLIDFTTPPPSLAMPFIRDGRIRAIATTAATRLKTLPDVPTMTELGMRDAVINFMFALVGPAGMPSSIAEKVARDVGEILRNPDFQAKHIEPLGYQVVADKPAEFAKFLLNDREKQRARVKAANVQLD